jgi:hypothetical protein
LIINDLYKLDNRLATRNNWAFAKKRQKNEKNFLGDYLSLFLSFASEFSNNQFGGGGTDI